MVWMLGDGSPVVVLNGIGKGEGPEGGQRSVKGHGRAIFQSSIS